MILKAKEIEVFDINEFAWYHFVLKFMIMRNLTYDDFYSFLVSHDLDDNKIWLKLKDYLPSGVYTRFNYYFNSGVNLNGLKVKSKIFNPPLKGEGSIIPYFSKENYYKLQEILKHQKLPNFICANILEMPKQTKKAYDLMLCSNVYDYIVSNPTSYHHLLDRFNCPEIEALYSWGMAEETRDSFLAEGFDLDYIPTSTTKYCEYEPFDKDLVFTLRK